MVAKEPNEHWKFWINLFDKTTNLNYNKSMKIPLNKTHEGCEVLVAQASSRVTYYIEAIDEESQTVQFRYANWDESIADERGYSKGLYSGSMEGWQVVTIKSRYNKPISIITELKVAFIELIHRIMANVGFQLK